MDEDAEAMTGELAEIVALNDRAARFVDPRTIPTRFSLLKNMALSPAHYLEACQRDQDDSIAARLARAHVGPDRSAALRFGTAAHAMLFGTGSVAVFRGPVRRGKAWEAFQRMAAEDEHVEILNEREHALAVEIVTAIRKHPTAMRLLFDGTIVETRIDWEWMGKACRSTPDARVPGKHVTDLKTCQSAQPEAFRRHALRLFYQAQASFYGTCLEEVGEPLPESFYVVAVEKARPFPVTVLRFTADAMELGAKLVRLWFERLQICEEANVWPVYAPSPAIVDLDIDHWGRDEEEAAGKVQLEIDGKKVAV